MDWSGLDLSILGPAFLAGLLVLATHVPLGREVLSRGIIFIDLAVAQIAGLGVIAAHTFGAGEHPFAVQLAALAAALGGALLLTWSEERFPEVQEALIGVSFVLAATLGILLLADNPHGGEQLKELLVGQILWVTEGMLVAAVVVSALVLAAWFVLGAARLGRTGFYLLFAVVVTFSVQLVGVYLVFASLIVPALATRALDGRRGVVVGWALGATAYAAGLIASALFDLPTGALIVWALAILGAIIAPMLGTARRDSAAHS
jgi:zinc/manganese transport system permease protein